MKFSIKDFFSKAADLVTFTEEILIENFILCAVIPVAPSGLMIHSYLTHIRIFLQIS